MDQLHTYASSDDDAVAKKPTPQNRRLPAPDALESQPPPKRLCQPDASAPALPVVLAVKPRPDRFLVHLCLPVVHERLDDFVRRLLGRARLRLVGCKVKAAFRVLDDFHVSVARPVVVREATIRGLVRELRRALEGSGAVEVALRAGVVGFENGNRRKVYVAAPLTEASGSEVASRLVRVIDRVYERNGLTKFFEEPKLHMSFGWTEETDVLPSFQDEDALQGDDDGQHALQFTVNSVRCSVGKLTHYFTLNQPSKGK